MLMVLTPTFLVLESEIFFFFTVRQSEDVYYIRLFAFYSFAS